MSTRLDPHGGDVHIGPVLLRTPGLAGAASVSDPAGGGVRGREYGTKSLLEAMADTGTREQLTITLTDLTNGGRSEGGRGTPSGAVEPDVIEVVVPAVAVDEGQMMLQVAEDGVAHWSFPVDGPGRGPTTRGGPATFTYVLPVTLRSAETAQPSAPGRGLVTAVAGMVLKVFVFPLLNPLLKSAGNHFAMEFERAKRFERWRTFTPDNHRTHDAATVRDREWVRLSEGRSLLFLHGTGAMAHTAFAGLAPAALERLSRRYEGRVFALDHHSLSVLPSTNVARAAKEIPTDLDFEVDIIAHSRGGLVARELAERARAAKLSPRFRVRSIVMVGTPNAGTALAERANISAWLDTMTNIAQLVPDNPVSDLLAVALTVAKHLAVGVFEGLEGVTSMDPSGGYLKKLNIDVDVPTRYLAIAADFEPIAGTALKRVHNAAIDALFSGSSNDLVVPTAGVATIPALARFTPESMVLDADQGIDHSSFFSSRVVSDRLLQWLSD